MQNVLIFCGNGYVFENYHAFIIQGLKRKCRVFLILDGSPYLSKKVIAKIERLHKESYIKEYYLTDLHGSRSLFTQYLKCIELLKQINKEKIGLFFTGEEGSIILCFLMEYFKLKGAKIVSNEVLIRATLFRDYYKTKGIFLENSETERFDHKLRRKLKNKDIKQILKGIFNLSLGVAKKPIQKLRNILGHRVIPFLLIRQSIQPTNQYMIGTHCDNLIVTDSIEYKGVKLLIPSVKKLYLAKHPAYEFCKNNTDKNRTKLLVIFGRGVDLTAPTVSRWVTVVEEIKRFKNPSDIHLRFHPRDGEKVRQRFEEAFRLKNIQTTVIDSVQNSIIEGVCQYLGVVSSWSSSLRFIRAASPNIFLIALAEVKGGLYGQPEAMGNTEGVHWLRKGDLLKKEMLDAPTSVKNQHPSIAEILIEILDNHNACA